MDSFVYQDTDSYENEIAELYSYSEESDFLSNRNAFEESMEDCGLPLTWKHMVQEQKTRALNHLMTTLEVSCRSTRTKSCRALAYLIQGNFGECLTLEEQAGNSRENVFTLYKLGLFNAFVQQISMEASISVKDNRSPSSGTSSAQLPNESSELRLIFSVLYTITEIMYHAKDSRDESILEIRQQFVKELQNPIGDELFAVTLMQMLNQFCCGQSPHYPVRKICLLLWKVLLITLGGSQELQKLKDAKRAMCNLDPVPDDTMEVIKNMEPSPPPLMPEQPRARAALLGGMTANKRKVFKQPAFDDAVFAYAKECLMNSLADINQTEDSEMEARNNQESNESSDETAGASSSEPTAATEETNMDNASNPLPEVKLTDSSSTDSGLDLENQPENINSGHEQEEFDLIDLVRRKFGLTDDETEEIDREEEFKVQRQQPQPQKLEPDSQREDGSRSETYRGLPWKPKVRKSDLSNHLSNLRQKFLGYTLPEDIDTTFGLPDPIIEGISVLRKHLYVSLSELQLERDELMQKYPLTHGELNPNYQEEAAEKLYAAILPRLPQYMIALLKILLAATQTTTKNKSERITESINIMSEVSPDVSSQSILETVKMNIDAIRHKEIIIKAISATLLLLLKHFKINHIYQFEYTSQQIMFANGIPLILKFLSQDLNSFIENPKSTISAIDFPACVIGEQPELTAVSIELGCFQPLLCWRNMFSSINLVRVLNKLIKWKHSRVMMLVVFKSSQTLLKNLSVKNSMFQLYILKLLKLQMKFLGRQWKKSNMRLISPIYQKVRHRLTDDWAFSNDNEARPWDFQAEEFTLQANINKFHQRRYQDLLTSKFGKNRKSSLVFEQFDKLSIEDDMEDEYDSGTSEMCSISPNFERNYQRWLESEVYRRQIDWDKLLN